MLVQFCSAFDLLQMNAVPMVSSAQLNTENDMKTANKSLFLFLIGCFFLTVGLSAQPVIHLDPNRAKQKVERPRFVDTMEVGRLEFVYMQTDIDTVLEQSYDDFFILQVGDEFSKYWGYFRFRLDSAYHALNWNLTYAKRDSFANIFCENVNQYQPPEFLCHLSSHTYKVSETYLLDSYVYEDSTARFSWMLRPDTTTVCGYVCRKAEATFRGIRWTVWYAPDIPLSLGPWKFNGLPGLVLWAYDDKGTHDVRLTAARKSSGTPITFQTKNRFRMKRERVNAQMRKFKIEMQPYDSATGLSPYEIDKDGNRKPLPIVRSFYVPYELE